MSLPKNGVLPEILNVVHKHLIKTKECKNNHDLNVNYSKSLLYQIFVNNTMFQNKTVCTAAAQTDLKSEKIAQFF
jgi:hypothetical protein